MASHAFKRPAGDSEGTIPPAAPQEDPLEVFAGLMGVDSRALQRIEGAEDVVPSAAPEIEAAPRLADDEVFVHQLLQAARPPRRSAALTLGVLVAVGAVGGGLGAWALMGAPGLPKAAPVAAVDPPKPPPAAAAPVDPVAAEKLASAFEQVQAPTPVAAKAAPAATPVAPSTRPQLVRSIAPFVAAPAETQVPATSAASAPAAVSEPKPVKAVSISPNGALLSSGAGAPVADAPSPAAAQEAPAAPLVNPPTPVPRPSMATAPVAAPKPARERPDAPPRPPANAPATRQSLARIDTAAPAPTAPPPPMNVAPAPPANSGGISADAVLQFVPNLYDKATSALRGPPPAAPAPAANPAPPPAVAAPAPKSGGFSADAVLNFVPNLYEKAASALRGSPPATQVARADPRPVAASDPGAYAVELAAPASEPAARREQARLRARYPSELGGRQPTVREAEVQGRKIYQLRVGGLSKADAAALCGRLKASGEPGCSVARE